MKHCYSRSTTKLHQEGEYGKSLNDYRKDKLFPHISDEYNFRINNRILISKIINPRRDKIIIDSLMHTHSKYGLKRKKPEEKPYKRLFNRRNRTAELAHPSQTKSRGLISPPSKQKLSHHSNSRQPSPVSQDHLFEGPNEIEEKSKEHFQNRKIPGVPKEQNNGYRSYYIGKIIRNTGSQSRLLDQSNLWEQNNTILDCDLSGSYYVKTGRILPNGCLASCRGKMTAKIRRMARPMLKGHLQSKQNQPKLLRDSPND